MTTSALSLHRSVPRPLELDREQKKPSTKAQPERARADRTAATSARPSAATQQAEAQAAATQRRAQIERMLPRPSLFPGGTGGGATDEPEKPMAPFGAESHALAKEALAERALDDPSNSYAQQQNQLRDRLDRLELLPKGDARIHIDEHVEDHGNRVVRAAAGETSLVRGADITLKTGAPANAIAREVLSPEQLARVEAVPAKEDRMNAGALSAAELVDTGADQLERQLLDKHVRVAGVVRALPDDDKLTLMNTSWSNNVIGIAGPLAYSLAGAPADSELGREASAILGHAPRKEPSADGPVTNEEDLNRLTTVMGERLTERLAEPEMKARFDRAREGFGDELARGRAKGLLVFSAAGNEHLDAAALGHPEWSAPMDSGVKNLIVVGAADASHADGVAPFSAEGAITLAAPGVDIPVGDFFEPNRSGTSYAAPIALQTAFLMSAANPKLSADQIAERLLDPRSVRDIPGTTRDGAGRLDPFAAVLIAKNPMLSRAQIEHARQELTRPDGDAAALRRELGLR